MDAATQSQVDAVVRLVDQVLGPDLVGLYLHGSVLTGGLRPTSDIDLLAVTRRSSTAGQRRALVEGLLDVSGRRARRTPGRPVELTVVVLSDVHPWRYPPQVELQYGEWLRDDYERGTTPGPGVDPDLALLASVALRSTGSLVGPPLAELLGPVPPEDVLSAAVAGVPGLLDDLEGDTRNVLLTLARIWATVATGDILSKDDAATWALRRLPDEHRQVVDAARADYLGAATPAWSEVLEDAQACAAWLVAEIERTSSTTEGLLAPDAPVPPGLVHESFVATPLTSAHVVLDHAAYTASPEVIRVHSDGRWPVDGFTVDQNRQLVARHEADHQARRAFTFVLLTPDGEESLGCLYLNPLRAYIARVGADPPTTERFPPGTAMVTFWVREDMQRTDLPASVASTVNAWLLSEWPIPTHLFRILPGETSSRAALEQLAVRRLPLDLPWEERPYLWYQPV